MQIINKNGKKIIHSLAHHNPSRIDFENHVFYVFDYALCIGCSAFFLGSVIALIIGNIFYIYIIDFISFPVMFAIFLTSCISSIIQYGFQILIKKPLKSRSLKFLIRFLYPLGSILFIFKSPILGIILAVSVGYLIIYIRRIKERILKIHDKTSSNRTFNNR